MVMVLGAISQIADEDDGAGELDEGLEVLDMVFPARHEPTVVIEPSDEAFDVPAAIPHAVT